MKKLTSFINESNKQDFTKKLLLKLDNNMVLEAKITVKDLSETYANTQISETLLNKTIKNITVIEEDEQISESVTIKEENPNNLTILECYIPWSTTTSDSTYYQSDKISNAIKDDEDVLSTHNENQFGWSNQPEIVVVKIETSDVIKTLERLKTKIQHSVGTQWVHISKKDW